MLNLESLEDRSNPAFSFHDGVLIYDAPVGGASVTINPGNLPGEVIATVQAPGGGGTIAINGVDVVGFVAAPGGLDKFVNNSHVNDSFNGTLGTDNIYVGGFGEIDGGCTGSGYNSFTVRSYGFADILLQGGYGTIVVGPNATITGNRTGYTIEQ